MLRSESPLATEEASRSHLGAKHGKIVAVVCVALVIILAGLVYSRWLSATQWDADEGIQLVQAQLMSRGYHLYSDIWMDQPPGVPLSLLAGFRIFGESVETGRLIVLLYALVGLAALALLAAGLCVAAGRDSIFGKDRSDAKDSMRLLAPGIAAVAAPLLMVLAPNFFWLARSVVRDIPATSVAMLAVALALVYGNTGRVRWLFLAGVVLGWALWLKLTAALYGVPLVALAAPGVWRASHRLRETVWAVAALAAGLILAWLPFLVFFDVRGFIDQALSTPVAARNVWPNRAPEYAQWLWEYLTIENLGITALAVVGGWALIRRRSYVGVVMLGWLALTAFVLVNQRPLFAKHHFLLFLFPLVALAGVGVSGVWDILRSPRRAGAVSVAVVLAALALVAVRAPGQASDLVDLVDPGPYRSLLEAVDWVKTHTAPGDIIAADPPMIAFRAGRTQIPWLAAQSSKRIETGQLTSGEAISTIEKYDPPAIVLWNGRLDRLDDYMTWIKQRYVPAMREKDRVLYRRFDPAEIQHPQSARLGDVAELIGYNLASDGKKVDVTLYWRALEPQSVDYTVFAHLVDSAGKGYGQSDGQPEGGVSPASTWDPGQIVVDKRSIKLPPDAPGELWLQVGMYDLASGARLPVTLNGQRVEGDQVRLDAPVRK
ncbi:MAG: hypothetical protein U0822_18865 [Anaerolineae bacterium]